MFWRRKGVLDMLAPCEADEEGRGEVIVRRGWCYGDEGIKTKCAGFREQERREAQRERTMPQRPKGDKQKQKG